LEREVEELLRNRVTSAGGNGGDYGAEGIVNINHKSGGGFERGAKSAQVGNNKRQHMKNNLMMNAAYQGGRQNNIYENLEEDDE
jgi:hypothetical protein